MRKPTPGQSFDFLIAVSLGGLKATMLSFDELEPHDRATAELRFAQAAVKHFGNSAKALGASVNRTAEWKSFSRAASSLALQGVPVLSPVGVEFALDDGIEFDRDATKGKDIHELLALALADIPSQESLAAQRYHVNGDRLH
jgi:hypothetical protein